MLFITQTNWNFFKFVETSIYGILSLFIFTVHLVDSCFCTIYKISNLLLVCFATRHHLLALFPCSCLDIYGIVFKLWMRVSMYNASTLSAKCLTEWSIFARSTWNPTTVKIFTFSGIRNWAVTVTYFLTRKTCGVMMSNFPSFCFCYVSLYVV